MPKPRLLAAGSKQYFAVKRFDRLTNQRLHVHSLARFSHVNFRVLDFDYEKLMRLTSILTKNPDDVKQVYRQIVFNILSNNQDDHTKNFSFVMKQGRLAVVYCLRYHLYFSVMDRSRVYQWGL